MKFTLFPLFLEKEELWIVIEYPSANKTPASEAMLLEKMHELISIVVSTLIFKNPPFIGINLVFSFSKFSKDEFYINTE